VTEQTTSGAERIPDNANEPDEEPSTGQEPLLPMQLKHALVHLVVLVAAFSLWAAADTWLIVTGLALASLLAVLTAAIAGLAVTTVMHEWCHFLGAKLSGAAYKTPRQLGVFVYEFNFEKNTVHQFYMMSLGGQLGGMLAIIILLLAIPLDNSGRYMLVAATAGSVIFAAVIEWPVLRRTRESQQPLVELSRIDRATIKQASLAGISSAAAIWLVFS
jgi:hypothetical protein